MKTSLYRHYDKDGVLLYVGVSLSVLHRLGQHADHSHWFRSIARVAIEHLESREAALEAERQAIQNERPLHNVCHNGGCQLPTTPYAERSRAELVSHVVNFKPVYTLEAAADVLGVSCRLVARLVRMGVIGHFTLPNKNGVPKPFISGWQLIDYIESLSVEPTNKELG